jgi:carbonic anhydrase
MTQDQILQRLKDGNTRFVSDKLSVKMCDCDRRIELLQGQNPFAIILSCADSRIVPELAFDAGLGELFDVRVAGNIASTCSLASIEYAVAHLGVKVVVVMGHENCGAVTAAVKGGNNGYNLNHLLTHITPAIEALPKDAPIDNIARKNAELSAMDLQDRSDIIRKAVKENQLQIIPAFYHLDSGKVDFMNN